MDLNMGAAFNFMVSVFHYNITQFLRTPDEGNRDGFINFVCKTWHMQQTWDERYNTPDYIYGTEPNQFFKYFIDSHVPGTIFLPGEGEGRNAVYAAKSGWVVEALDQSRNARNKALALAEQHGVSIQYELGNILEPDFRRKSYDAVGLIFIHMTPDKRNKFYHEMIGLLNPGGYIVVEGFTKSQINNTSGGPKDIDMLFSRKDMEDLFRGMEVLELYEYRQFLEEGFLHTGKADTIRLIARKKE